MFIALEEPTWPVLAVIWTTIVFFGLALGSFATAIAYRSPRGIPWAFKEKKDADISAYRSACTHCKKTLRAVDLVPLLSWLSTGGKCRYCGQKIGYLYPFTELTVLACVILSFWVFGVSLHALIIALAVPFLVALLVIDLEHMILPNQLVLVVGVLGLVRLALDWGYYGSVSAEQVLIGYIGGAAVFAGLSWFLGWMMTRVLKKDALGFGDVKFFAVSGLWLGIGFLGWFCLLAGLLGVFLGLIWGKINGGKVFPFGPALIAALYVLLLVEGSLFL